MFEGTSIRKFPGNYSDYLLVRKFQQEEEEEKANPAILRPKRISKGLSYNEQRELDQTTVAIDKVEAELLVLEEKLASGKLTHTDYTALSKEMDKLSKQHEGLLERWMHLSEKIVVKGT